MRCRLCEIQVQSANHVADSEIVELIVGASAATASDPDKIDKPIAQPPTMTSGKFLTMMNELVEYCQWQYCVTVDHLKMHASRQIGRCCRSEITARLVRFSCFIQIFSISLFSLRIMLCLCIATCIHRDDTLAACIVSTT